MSKTRLGLGALALITLGLTIYILSLGVGARSDNKTFKAATSIAERLNAYVNKENKAPDSLNAANIKDVPDTISYTKKGDKEYEFCATYKNAKNYGDDGGGVVNQLTTMATQKAMGAAYGSAASEASPAMFPAPDSPSLYISPVHTKGKNCQTVKPFDYRTYPAEDTNSGSTMESGSNTPGSAAETNNTSTLESTYASYCEPSGEYYQYVKDYCSGAATDLMTQ